jgi:hypothetical protein
MKQEMTTQDIVKNSDEVKRNKLDWEKVYVGLAKAIETDTYRIIRSGNTLFVIKILEPHVASLSTFNAEKSFKDYVRNIKDFLKAMEIAGYKELKAVGVNIQMINIMKNAGYNIEAEPIADGWYAITGTKGVQ